MSKTKLKLDKRSNDQPQPRKIRLGFLRKWDIVLVLVGSFLILATIVIGGQPLIGAAILLLGVFHFHSRRKEEKVLSGTNDEMYPVEEQSKRLSLEFLAVTVLIILWCALIISLPFQGWELIAVFDLMTMGIFAWAVLGFVCSLFPVNKFTMLFPFSAFAVGMVMTVIYASA